VSQIGLRRGLHREAQTDDSARDEDEKCDADAAHENDDSPGSAAILRVVRTRCPRSTLNYRSFRNSTARDIPPVEKLRQCLTEGENTMRVSAALALFLITAVSAFATPFDDVRKSEIAFAKAFADQDQAAFFRFVLDDATFLAPRRTMAGKQAIIERWSRYFASPEPPFSWGPDRVAINAAGSIAETAGPVYDAQGRHIANFNSVWVKQSDGTWKVLFDGPGSPAAVFAADATPVEEGDIAADDGAKLHFKKAGNGTITVIVPLSFVVYDDFKQLADIASVITYDPRGRGRSSPLESLDSVTIQQDVRDLETVRAHFKADQFVPIGFSYLGLMVAMYTIDHPEHVTRLVQIGPVPRKAGTQYPKRLANGMGDVVDVADDTNKWREMKAQGMVESAPREFCEADAKVFRYVLIGNPAHASRIKSNCDLPNEWPVNTDKHFEHLFASINAVNIDPAKITVPALVIHGTKDRNAPYGSGRECAMSLPDARLVTVEGAAHVSWADDPIAVFGSIREFLRGNWPLTAEKVTVLDPQP
jgi:pimeloyl-ACP methyl ester carboxylesterase/ketosteroid isomerase-like protein